MTVELPRMPSRIGALPRDHRGYPVPWFVAKVNDEWDFRVIRPGGIVTAHNKRICWVCGQRLGRFFAFVIGPMCAINRISSEPPSHVDCADWSARACPFLTRPRMRRNEKDMPEEATHAGIRIARNPGVALVWATRTYTIMKASTTDGGKGILFRIGDPISTGWYREGRPATRAEVEESIESGFPILSDMAHKEGPQAVAELMHMRHEAEAHLPVE